MPDSDSEQRQPFSPTENGSPIEKSETGGRVPADGNPSSDLSDLVESARQRAKDAQKNTERVYRRSWEHFTAFCEDRGLSPLPARPETVGLFIEKMATEGYAVSTINIHLAAIKKRHKRAGERSPTDAPAVEEQWENVRETIDREPNRKEPVLMEDLRQMTFDPSELSELRDRAVLFVGFAGGFRRSELVGLHVRDLTEAEGGIVYRIRDPKGRAQTESLQVPDRVPGLQPTPNEALREWLQAAGIDSGPLFRMVDRWGNVRDGALSGQSVYNIVRDRMEAIGHDPDEYGAHSLRAGFATQAYIDGIGEHEAAVQTRHASLKTLREYQRVHVVMEDHPLSRMGEPQTGTEKSSDE
jgi:site-specific recombinase XerD